LVFFSSGTFFARVQNDDEVPGEILRRLLHKNFRAIIEIVLNQIKNEQFTKFDIFGDWSMTLFKKPDNKKSKLFHKKIFVLFFRDFCVDH